MPRFANNGFYNDDDLIRCIYCNRIADTKDHTPSRFLCKNIRDGQSRITVPCCRVCNNWFSALELRCQNILELILCGDLLTDNQISDLRTICIKNAIGIIFHFYAVKLDFNSDIIFSIDTNISQEKFIENFTALDFNICPSIDVSISPTLVLYSSTSDCIGILKYNINNIGESVIGYSKEPYCVKFIYKGAIGLSVEWK